jgi:hypothetical protein
VSHERRLGFERFIIQVDTACHKIPRFVEKAVAAGVKRVFIGLENIDPDNLSAATLTLMPLSRPWRR